MATVTVTPGYSWSSGEIVTPAKMNLAAAPTVTAVVADGEVTDAKLATGIDASKLTTGTLPIARIADGDVVNAKLASDIDASKLTTGTLPIARIADGAVTNDKLSLAANAGEIKKALNADNAAPIFACRAWVDFDGQRNATDTGASTNGANVLIKGSGNVASVLKNSAGDYTITFTTAMPDANFAVLAFAWKSNTGTGNTQWTVEGSGTSTTHKTSSTCRVWVKQGPGLGDAQANVAIFR